MKKTRIFILTGLICLMTLASAIFAVSRHSKEDAPVRFSITIAEGETLLKTISCYDPDGDPVVLTTEDLPTGAIGGDQVTQPPEYADPDLPSVPIDAPNAVWYTRDLSWTPNYQQSGSHTIYIHAVDSNGDDDWVVYEIIVTNSNRPPVL